MRRLVLIALLGGCATTQVPTQQTSTIREVSPSSCEPLDWPVIASISSPFGSREEGVHQGIDLPVPEGTPVVAACDGVVTYASDKQRGYGQMIMLQHDGGLVTLYAHNSVLLVNVGDRVVRGSVIARSGQTGRVTAPHVHFEVRLDGKAIDPIGRLSAMGSLVQR